MVIVKIIGVYVLIALGVFGYQLADLVKHLVAKNPDIVWRSNRDANQVTVSIVLLAFSYQAVVWPWYVGRGKC